MIFGDSESNVNGPAECVLCEKKLGQTGSPLFWRIKLEQHGLKLDALQRQQGLGMMLGGHGKLAEIMGPNDDMTQIVSERTVTVCQPCAGNPTTVYTLGFEEP